MSPTQRWELALRIQELVFLCFFVVCFSELVLEFVLLTKLALNLQKTACLSLPGARIKGIHHHHVADPF